MDVCSRYFPPSSVARFEAASTERVFRVAASDYLDPQFLPLLVADIKRAAPLAGIEILPLTADADYRQRLAAGPWKRPEGWGDIGFCKVLLGRLPDRGQFIGDVHPDREARNGRDPRIGADEGLCLLERCD